MIDVTDQAPIKHGTPGGYSLHLYRGEYPCKPCRAGHTDYSRAWRIVRGAGVINVPVELIGLLIAQLGEQGPLHAMAVAQLGERTVQACFNRLAPALLEEAGVPRPSAPRERLGWGDLVQVLVQRHPGCRTVLTAAELAGRSDTGVVLVSPPDVNGDVTIVVRQR